MRKNKERPTCDKVDCAGCENGYCNVLVDNNFWDGKCVFFKTKEQAEEEKMRRLYRLMKITGKGGFYA